MNAIEILSELENLRSLHRRIVEADCERRRYRHLMNEFVHRGRIIFGNGSFVYRDVYDHLFDYDYTRTLLNEVKKNEQL